MDGSIVTLIGIAFLPVPLWLAYFIHQVGRDARQRAELGKAFGLGMLITLPVALVEGALFQAGAAISTGVAAILLVIGIAPVVEEFAKFQVVRRIARRRQPTDGLFYAIAVALGFASIENAVYFVGAYIEGSSLLGWVIVGRLTLSTTGHVLFAAMWGSMLGLQRAFPREQRLHSLTTRELYRAMIWHGGYNLLAMGGLVGALVFLPLAWERMNQRIRALPRKLEGATTIHARDPEPANLSHNAQARPHPSP